MPRAVLNVPAGALSSPTMITIAEDPSGPPAPYVALSPLFRFSPEGLVFAKLVTVSFSTSSNSPDGNVYWSLASGPGYEALPTTWSGEVANALISHFSTGFVGLLPGGPSGDGGIEDAVGIQDTAVPQDSDAAEDSTAPGDAAASDMTSQEGGGGDGAGPGTDASSADAGTTFLTGLLEGPTVGSVTIAVDEVSAVPGADGGCGDTAVTDHQEVTIPGADLPYIYRFYFGGSAMPACTERTYNVSVTQVDDGGEIASDNFTCSGTFGATVECDDQRLVVDAGSSEAAVPDAGAPDEADASGDAGDPYTQPVTFTVNVTGSFPVGASFIGVQLDEAYHLLEQEGPGMPLTCGTPTNVEYRSGMQVVRSLPATVTVTSGSPPYPGFCSASFQFAAYPLNAALENLGTASSPLSAVGCGSVGNCPGPSGIDFCGGANQIQSTTVDCGTLSLP